MADSGDVIGFLGILLVIGLIVGGVALMVNGFVSEQDKYTSSVKEEVITVKSISPAPGFHPNDFGQLMCDNAQQLMFYDTNGVGYENTEDDLMGKYETRDILINMKIGGTYKIKYVGWRDGQNSRYPNILAIVEVVNETDAVGFSWNDFLGDWNLKDTGIFDISNYKLVDGKMVYVGQSNGVDSDAYNTQITNNKKISDSKKNN